jgi:hypothetical protein
MTHLFLVLLAGAPHHTAVAEATVTGETRDAEMGQTLAKALGAATPAEVAQTLSERFPAIGVGVKSEMVLEAGRMVERGRDAYLDGKFAEATADLGRAREMLARAIESFEEERQAAETLFRAHLYLAFTLRAKGGDSMPQAVEAMKEAIRTFPHLEPAFSEYGPENIRFYKDIRAQMDRGARGRLRVTTPGEQASVYLNGRLVGVTPLDAKDLYAGRYRMHLRQGGETSRVRIVDIEGGDKEMEVDFSFDRALRTDEGAALVYTSGAERRAHLARHGAALARATGVQNAMVYWTAEGKIQLAQVDRIGNVRIAQTTREAAPQTAVALAEGRIGELFKAELPHGKRVWTWVAGGVTAAALITGVIYGLAYNSDLDDLNRQCPQGACTDPRLLNQREDAKNEGLVADVMFGVAGAAAVTTAILWFYEGRPKISERAEVTPVVGPRFAGAQVEIRF